MAYVTDSAIQGEWRSGFWIGTVSWNRFSVAESRPIPGL
jgi:hypothetical protein